MTQYYNFQNIFKKERKKEKERKKNAYSRFVNAFLWISKNYDFRFQIFCHIDVALPYFCFRCGGGGASGTLSNYSFKMVTFKGNNVHTMRLQPRITK